MISVQVMNFFPGYKVDYYNRSVWVYPSHPLLCFDWIITKVSYLFIVIDLWQFGLEHPDMIKR